MCLDEGKLFNLDFKMGTIVECKINSKNSRKKITKLRIVEWGGRYSGNITDLERR